MATGLSPTSGAQAATQAGYQQLKLQQARRNAEQAEQTAQGLRAQASAAQQTANQAQETARSLSTQADQAKFSAGQARQGLAAIDSLKTTESTLLRAYDTAIQTQARQSPVSPEAPTQPTAETEVKTPRTVIDTFA